MAYPQAGAPTIARINPNLRFLFSLIHQYETFAEISTYALFLFLRVQASLDADTLATRYFGNDASWYINRIPFFESSDETINEVYYYRWKTFRSHQRDLGTNGYISTEFLNDVSWQTNPWASLNDATGFHLLEGRWCRDRRFKEDYASFMLNPTLSNTRQYSESMAAAIYAGYLVDGVAQDATARLENMQTIFDAWEDSYDSTKNLYWVEPLRDATEYTISSIDATNGEDGFTGGNAFRPSINSFQYANARAIANLATLKGGMQDIASTYNSRADDIKTHVQNSLWNSTFQHFIDRFQVNNTYVTYWDFIRGRELVGYVPWTHDLPDDSAAYAQSWAHVLNTSQLAGPHGLRTNEPSYQYYMRQYRYDAASGGKECQWNGPVWPFQTTQVLTGLANFLDHYPNGSASTIINSGDYIELLKQYAHLHYNPSRGGILDLEEDYYPDTGAPIVGLTRSPHYFHSGFIDVILTGLVGIRPSADDVLEVNPLVNGSSITYFRAERILYHGHDVAVQWDVDGSHYGVVGLQVEIDGRTVAASNTLGRVNATVSRLSPPSITQRIAKSVQLNSTAAYPVGNVSTSDTDVSSVHGAIDGRIFFYPEIEVANGWDTPRGNGSQVWFSIDFGAEVTVNSSEIAFFANDTQGYDVPSTYTVQVPRGESWNNVTDATYAAPVANGITEANWTELTTRNIRLAFTPNTGTKVRLVEFKVY